MMRYILLPVVASAVSIDKKADAEHLKRWMHEHLKAAEPYTLLAGDQNTYCFQ